MALYRTLYPAMDHGPHANQLLDGYRLIRPIGRGGFGEVWLCRSESMGGWHALKFIPATGANLLEKEFHALALYRKEAARLRSPHLVAIEHINRNAAGLYYVMPLADGVDGRKPDDPDWQPLSLSHLIQSRLNGGVWFSSAEITALMSHILEALQTLTAVALVHRDVKPDNILFFDGKPCLGDISLLGEDAETVTRRGTPGYARPSWYVGGHPDMFGAAATLYTLLTGNLPDKMGRSAFQWPPQGESFLPESERQEWLRLHAVVRRATEEKVAERFVDFAAMAGQISVAGAPVIGVARPVKPRFPRLIVSALTVVGVAAATVVAGFRSRPPETEKTSNSHTAKDPVPELTAEQKADYQALAAMIQGYIGDGNYANALASVENLLATYPQARTQPTYSIARAIALKGLGRMNEAKEELKKDVHLSPQIPPMSARKELWEQFGDLDSAEKDLSRILEKFGTATFPLFLRADVRAQRGDFAGVHADREAAYKVGNDPKQRLLVDTMWEPLAVKYPGYVEYVRGHPLK